MLIEKAVCEEKKCSRWIEDSEIKKLKIIKKPVFIETLLGTILAFINYFVVRITVYTTGEQFIPAFKTDADKFVVVITWISFSFMILISIFQLISNGKIYIIDNSLTKDEVNYYKYELFKRFNKVTIVTIFYIIIYQIIFQITIKDINIKSAILWWIVILNILIFISLIVEKIRDRVKLNIMDNIIKQLSDKIEKEDYNGIVEAVSKENYFNNRGDIRVKVTYRAIDELLNIVRRIVKEENKSRDSKDELITNVSHDLKTPLTTIINYVDFLKNRDLKREVIDEYTDILYIKANRIKVLLDDLKEISESEKDHIQMKFQNISLKKVLDDALFDLKEKLEEAKLNIDIQTKIESDELRWSTIDYDKTLRIFQNILLNISKYSKVNSDVSIVIYQENSMDFDKGYYTLIRFINIYEDKIELSGNELIERFRRGDSARSKEGNGLGLNIVENLLKIQGGELVVNIDENKFILEVII